jgi:hypothetical protein
MNRIADAQEAQRPGIYIEAEPNFQTSLAAAIIKKHVPVQIVTDKSKADYVLKASGVNAHTESGASQFARCLLAYCVGADGSSSVSVQLVKSDAVVWAYQVRKANGGPAGIQSLAEAIAKHLKNNFMNGQK